MNLPERYTLANIKRAARDPSRIRGEAIRLGLAANGAWSRLTDDESPCDVVEEDWDTLVILDGCRYDLFEEVNTLDGRLESRRSAGSESWEFLRENFQGRQLYDTVYVTANPFAPKLDDVFHRQLNLLRTHWDGERRTVTPDVMTEEAIAAHEAHPNKRLIVHYMQPHFPFIGELGRKIGHAGVNPDTDTDGDEAPHVWLGLQNRTLDVDEELVYAAYRENLELTLPYVQELLDSVDGKTVVTSDHGNLVGERTWPLPIKGYGHPRGLRSPGLVDVPWLVVEGATRRQVTADPSVETEEDEMESEVLEKRLADLGYQ